MWNPERLKIVAAVTLLAGSGIAVVLACGPDFPLQLLDDRAGTLKSTPANSFAFEAAHLVEPGDKLEARDGIADDSNADAAAASPAATVNPGSPAALDRSIMNADQLARAREMRTQADGDAAYDYGKGVPPAVRLYIAGAVDYRLAGAGNNADSIERSAALMARAQRRFEAVLALPPAEGKQRAVWAAYMLGQSRAEALLAASSAANPNDIGKLRTQAESAYVLARQRAIAGAADPFGLAVASFGEQARLHLIRAGRLCGYLDFEKFDDCADAIPAADLKQAIRLYAEQAARGSDSGLQSLRYLATWALSDAERAARLIDDPLAQRLLVAYALARVGDIVNDDPASASDYFAGAESGASYGYADAARGGSKVKPNPVLASLVGALQARGLEKIAGADRVAALAYRAGRYDLAQTLAERQQSALSTWVKAKLALRKGDMAAAAQFYAQAARSFAPSDSSLERANAALLKAEGGVLSLSRGQYVEALDQLYTGMAERSPVSTSSDYYGTYVDDLAYIAERVLTSDELKAYVDAHVPATPLPPAPPAAALAAGSTPDQAYYGWSAQHPKRLADRLRQLLARRLVREARIDEALPYFPDAQDARYVEIEYSDDGKTRFASWRARTLAQQYGAALEQGKSAWRASKRAEGWYQAAVIARAHGMEIMGYEQGPDFTEFGGAYTYGVGRSDMSQRSFTDADEKNKSARPDTPQTRAAAALPGPFVTEEERRRYAASEARPNKRFHYRDIAADYALKAADELPPRSQAFAAVLCRGTAFVINDAERASELYRRYVKQGAAVPFAADFGRQCVEPDFSAAGRFPYVQAWRTTQRWMVQHRRAAAVAALALLVLIGGGVWGRARRRKARAADKATVVGPAIAENLPEPKTEERKDLQ
ncbi:hypothetical protein PQR62_02790 [Herbaspirillum lusitanum]|uniref:Uncharacterized protein n=1 Tax=Herbaspirillum lusitanum TaxID=213312 RepID=A0ABW9A2S1_9BURK